MNHSNDLHLFRDALAADRCAEQEVGNAARPSSFG
jgi:hypothetical protein